MPALLWEFKLKNKFSVQCGAVLSCLLVLSNYAMDEEDAIASDFERVIVVGTAQISQTDAQASEPIVQIVGSSKAKDSITFTSNDGLVDPAVLEVIQDEISIDLAQRNTVLQEQFAAADANGDGYLEVDEYAAEHRRPSFRVSKLPREIASAPRTHFRKIAMKRHHSAIGNTEGVESVRTEEFWTRANDDEFDTADVDGDGQLSRAEYRNRGKVIRDRSLRRQFSNLDVNQDSFVDSQEFAVEIERLQKLDEDQDGIVSFEELMHTRARR